MNKQIVVIGVLVVLLFSSFAVGFGSASAKGNVMKMNERGVKGYATHNIIRINSDADFDSSHGVVNGSGTQSDPYIISGWDIDAHGAGDAIYIGNTTAYFVVENCYLHNTSYHSWPYFAGNGIMLSNVKNGEISGNNITNNDWDGIYLSSSIRNTISKNNITNNGWDGIELWDSISNTISKNNITNSSIDGIELGSSSSNTISGNNITNNGYGGIELEGPNSNNIISGNKMIEDSIYLSGNEDTFTTQTIDTNNTVNGKPVYYYKNVNMDNASVPLDAGEVICGNVSWLKIESLELLNGTVGIELGYSSNITISRNNITNNGYSIYLWASSSNTIYNNLISNNTDYGIYINSGAYNLIYNNSFYYNHGSGDVYNSSYVQAYDDGSNNSWNSTTGIGNYWHDWANNNDTNDQNNDGIVDWPYKIDGSAGAKDYYPLKNASLNNVLSHPMNLTARAGDGYVNLTWNPPVYGNNTVTEYRIYRNGAFITSVPVTQLYYNDTNVVNGQKYTYYVTANNSVGESTKSNEVQATPSGAVPEFSTGIWLFIVVLISLLGVARFRKSS